jgi:hypothetical protein
VSAGARLEVSQKRKKCRESGSEAINPADSFNFCLGVFCAKQKTMKTIVSKVKRSGVYYLMATIASVDEKRNARSDTWGAVAVVVLLLGVVSLVRLFLTL